MEHTKRYLNGFREGFNNPNQYKNQSDKLVKSNDDYIKGIISGYCKKMQRLQEGKNYFIWNDGELQIEVREDQ